MAYSPTQTRSPTAASNPLRLRALTVLQKSSSAVSTPASDAASSITSLDPLPDFSEQMNAETRDKFVKGNRLGEGTYAVVFKAHLRTDPTQLFAIKKIKVNADYQDGVSMDAIREVKFLQELRHPNIIRLEAVFSSKDQNMNLVLEFLPLGDLEMLIKDTENIRYGVADIKAWMAMLCRGVWWCHQNFVLHRDIKPNNLLIAADGEVKLADFGLARSFADPYAPMTHQVITRWYRPPELFYKARYYSGAVDVWSCGCVFAELILRTPYLPGDSDIDQIDRICKALGTPIEENWPGVNKLESYVAPATNNIIPFRRMDFLALFGTIGEVGVDLLRSMLMLDPRKRPTGKGVLMHEWWVTGEKPTRKEELPRKSGGEKKLGEDLQRRGGQLGDKVAKKLDFGAMKR